MSTSDALQRRQQFYREQAEWNGECAVELCAAGWADEEQPRGFARLAAHFGRLALGETEILPTVSEVRGILVRGDSEQYPPSVPFETWKAILGDE